MDERKRSLRKEIVRLALPIALQQFMTALVGACDAIMLGKLSQDAMSAVSLATQVTLYLICLCLHLWQARICLWHNIMEKGITQVFPRCSAL